MSRQRGEVGHLRSAATAMSMGWRAGRGQAIATVVIVILGQVSGIANALWFRSLIDAALAHHTRGIWVASIGAALTMLVSLFGYVRGYDAVRLPLREDVARDADVALMRALSRGPTLAVRSRADLLDDAELVRSRRSDLADAFEDLVGWAALVAQLAVAVAILATIAPVLIVVVAFAMPSAWAARHADRLRDTAAQEAAPRLRLARDFEALTEGRGAREVRIFGLAPTLIRRHRDEWNNARSLLNAADGRAAVATTAAWGLFVLGYGLAMAVVLRQASSGHASAGDVVLAMALAAQLSGHVQGIIRNGHFLLLDLRVCAALRRITDHDRLTDESRSRHLAPPTRLTKGIELAAVRYRYPGAAADAVRNVSLRLPAGSLVAVVGENGAGKSTLVNLLAGLLAPTSGQITIDGQRIDHIHPQHYSARVGASFQDHAHFELTARHAVGVGHLPLIDDEEAISATLARVTGGRPSWLVEGLDTKLGASWDGQDVSGGEWQALALARGAMRPLPLLLLLDEPTASLDPRAEARVYERYATLAREAADQAGTVTVFVTHRFASVPDADLIVVLEQGRLVETGTHAELMRRDGHYATLYRLQARGFVTR